MNNSLPDLYTYLRLTPSGLTQIFNSIHCSYADSLVPKKKYGEVQTENGKIRYRKLLVPIPELKAVQERIMRLLQKIELPFYMYGSIRKRSHILNAKQHLNQTHFCTIDLENFFPNINHHQVFQMFRRNGFSPSVSRILTKLTTYKKSLPQGAPCSNVIANLVFLPTAEKLCEFANEHGLVYTNYLDDQSFSSKKYFKELVPQILDIIRSDNFVPSDRKIHYKTYKCEITGLLVKGNRLMVIPEMRLKAQNNIHLRAYVNHIDKQNRK